MAKEFRSKLRSVLAGRRDLDRDLRDEIEAQVEFETQANLERGMSAAQARAAARRHAGNLTRIQEEARASWTFASLETFAQDVRYGLRAIRRSPGFAGVVLLTLALGIGANTAIFSVVNAVLLRPLPFPAAERLVQLGEADPKAEGISVTWINFQHWRAENRSFEAMAGFHTAHFTLTGRGDAALTRAGVVTSEFFDLTGARTVIGRVFDAADDRPGAAPVAVLDHRFWTTKLGADPAVLGSTLDLDGKAFQVIGVLAPGPRFFTQPIDFYIPLGPAEGATVDRARHGSTRLLARLKPGTSLRAALADLNGIMARLAQTDPGPESPHKACGKFLVDYFLADVRPTLLILLGAVGLVLLIACANVASLIGARALARSREIAIRSAIGAGRLRLARQLLTENLVLAAMGGVAGVLLAQWGSRMLIAAGPRDIPRLAETGFDARVLVFAGVLTVLTAALTGLAPVFTAGRLDLATVLKDGTRSATGSRGGHGLRGMLVAGEIALTLVLAFTAGLLARHLIAAQNSDPGFAPDHVLALELVLPRGGYQDDAATAGFYSALERDLRSLPGVTAVGAVNCPPSAGDCGDWFYSLADRPAPPPADVPIALFNTADTNYFAAMQIPLREGRAFTSVDRAGGPLTAVVNETFARKWFPKETAVGRRIKSGGPYREGPIYEIVGVCGNVSQMGLGTEPYPEIYLPMAQSPNRAMVVMVRAAADPANLAPAVRGRLRALDRNLPVESLRPLAGTLSASLAGRRFNTLLLALFAGLAIVLAAVGMYGMIGYWVRQREDEIAIRMALGAGRSAILQWAGGQALRLTLIGTALGTLASWAAAKWLARALLGSSAGTGSTLAMAALAVTAIGMSAAAVPLYSATRMQASLQFGAIGGKPR